MKYVIGFYNTEGQKRYLCFDGLSSFDKNEAKKFSSDFRAFNYALNFLDNSRDWFTESEDGTKGGFVSEYEVMFDEEMIEFNRKNGYKR